MPNNEHSDERHFTLRDLLNAAKAADIDPLQAVDNIVDTVSDVLAAAASLPEGQGAQHGSDSD